MAFYDSVKRFFALDEEVSEEEDQYYDENPEKQKVKKANIISLPSPKKHEIIIIEPKNFQQAQKIADQLKLKKPIIVNVIRADKELACRVIDFLSGVTYALDGHVQKIEEQIFLFTPNNMSISWPKVNGL